MRAEWLAATRTGGMDVEQMVRFVVRTQLDVVEQSAGDPAFLTKEHYEQSAGGLTDRDRLYVLDQVIKDLQLMAKDVPSLIKMLDVGTTRPDALSALERKGGEAATAIPRLVEVLRGSDQLECCIALRTLVPPENCITIDGGRDGALWTGEREMESGPLIIGVMSDRSGTSRPADGGSRSRRTRSSPRSDEFESRAVCERNTSRTRALAPTVNPWGVWFAGLHKQPAG
jgi:hypothetical protein